MSKNSLTITDNRTGKTYEIPIEQGTIQPINFRQIKISSDDFGLMSYDPAFMNTASNKSSITFIDGDNGILRYRGYPIEELAEKSSYLETAYLLLNGELPTKEQLDLWIYEVTDVNMIHENIKKVMDGFHYDAHPMGMFISSIAALSTFYPESKEIYDLVIRHKQICRIIAKVPTLAAYAYRHAKGLPYIYPDNQLSYTGNFLRMLFMMTEPKYNPNPVLERALDILFILHADHEQNCSTNTMCCVGSTFVDPYSATAAAAAALYGPLHGGANEAALRMLEKIGSKKNIPNYIKKVKTGKVRLMGFGHRIYKNYDPRAKIIRKLAYDVFEVTGKDSLIDIALELEKIALEDDYFIKRKLYPNVDLYSGLIYKALGFPVSMFPVLFAIARTSGWISHWQEMLHDKEQKIARPRQIYLGYDKRVYIPINKRKEK